MGFLDSIGSAVSSVGDFINNNSKWIQPVAGYALNEYNQGQQKRDQQNLFNVQAQAEQADWQRRNEERNRYLSWYQSRQAYEDSGGGGGGGGRGGGGGGGGAPSGRMTAEQYAAYQRALEAESSAYASASQRLKPFGDVATALLPDMSRTYNTGNVATQALLGNMMTPERMAALSQSVPAQAVPVAVPDYLKR